MADTQDLFVERFNADDARLYEFEGEWRRAEVVREEITVKGRAQPEALDVTITHHGPIVNEALGADGEQPLALSWTGLQYPCITEAGYRTRARAQRGRDRRGDGGPRRAAAQHAVGRQRREHRLPARRARCRSAQGDCPDLPEARLDGRVRVGGHDPLRRAADASSNPPEGFIVTANNRIVGRRLSPPHHLRVDDRLPRAADRGDARRARAPLARGLRADAARLLLVPGHRDRPPALAPSSAEPARRCARSSG